MGDELELFTFYEKSTATEVAATALHEEYKGYVAWICGRNDKPGFPMTHGVLTKAESAFCWVRDALVIDQEELEGVQVCLQHSYNWMSIWVFSTWLS